MKLAFQRDSFVLAGVFGLIYLVTVSSNLSLAHDGIQYINQIDAGSELWHPHHLFFGPLAFGWVQLCRLIGWTQDSVLLVGTLNALFGTAAIWLTHQFLRRRLQLSRAFAAAATAAIGFSFGFWYYSTCVEVYLPPLTFLIATLSVLSRPRLTGTWLLTGGVLFALAILFHEMSILFAPVILVLLLGRQRLLGAAKQAAVLFAIAGVVAILAYVCVGVFAVQLRSGADLVNWVTLYASEGRYWQPFGARSVLLAGVGFSRAIMGGHFLFALSGMRERLQAQFSHNELRDEAFLVRHLEGSAAILLVVGVAVCLLAFAVAAYRARAWLGTLRAPDPGIRAVAVWLIFYAAFFFFWVPQNVEFWIPQAWCVWVILFTALDRQRNSTAALRLSVVGVACLATVNLAGSIHWTQSRENDRFYVLARAADDVVGSGGLVVTESNWILPEYLRRYSDATVETLRPNTNAQSSRLTESHRIQALADSTLSRGDSVLLLWRCGVPGTVGSVPEVQESEVELCNSYGARIQEVELLPEEVYSLVTGSGRTPGAP